MSGVTAGLIPASADAVLAPEVLTQPEAQPAWIIDPETGKWQLKLSPAVALTVDQGGRTPAFALGQDGLVHLTIPSATPSGYPSALPPRNPLWRILSSYSLGDMGDGSFEGFTISPFFSDSVFRISLRSGSQWHNLGTGWYAVSRRWVERTYVGSLAALPSSYPATFPVAADDWAGAGFRLMMTGECNAIRGKTLAQLAALNIYGESTAEESCVAPFAESTVYDSQQQFSLPQRLPVTPYASGWTPSAHGVILLWVACDEPSYTPSSRYDLHVAWIDEYGWHTLRLDPSTVFPSVLPGDTVIDAEYVAPLATPKWRYWDSLPGTPF